MRKKLGAIRKQVRALAFKGEVSDFTRQSLSLACKTTPTRELDVIRYNQIEKKNSQYDLWQQHGGTGVTQRDWLASRAPARFLYQLSWVQVAYSAGLSFPVSANVLAATTRNPDEPEPQRGYAQWRGGKFTLSVAIYNPFLETPQREYKNFMGSEILGAAMEKKRPQFIKRVERQLKRILYAIQHA
jgi:hypothetical protein